jgi:hypothetical protein
LIVVDLAFGQFLFKRNRETLRLVSKTLVVELSRMLGKLAGQYVCVGVFLVGILMILDKRNKRSLSNQDICMHTNTSPIK